MYLHEDSRALFRDIVLLTSERMNVAADIVEKDYYYEPISDFSVGGLQPYVKLEMALMSYAFPTTERSISNYIYRALSEEKPELMELYGLVPFPMRVQSVERTLIDKIFALCDYYMQGKPERNSRHMYDIYKLANYTAKDDSFRKLICEVREHRATLDGAITPSARADVDVKRLIHRLCEEDFYAQDYTDITAKLISDRLDYETVRDFYLEFTNDLF